jgi:hypothetical protein
MTTAKIMGLLQFILYTVWYIEYFFPSFKVGKEFSQEVTAFLHPLLSYLPAKEKGAKPVRGVPVHLSIVLPYLGVSRKMSNDVAK